MRLASYHQKLQGGFQLPDPMTTDAAVWEVAVAGIGSGLELGLAQGRRGR